MMNVNINTKIYKRLYAQQKNKAQSLFETNNTQIKHYGALENDIRPMLPALRERTLPRKRAAFGIIEHSLSI